MSKKAKDVKSVPFFARFIEKQATSADNTPIDTRKFPSDWEEW